MKHYFNVGDVVGVEGEFGLLKIDLFHQKPHDHLVTVRDDGI